jgi:hypothetical protein
MKMFLPHFCAHVPCTNEQEGALETFRPYAIPEPGWLEKTLGVELTEQAS